MLCKSDKPSIIIIAHLLCISIITVVSAHPGGTYARTLGTKYVEAKYKCGSVEFLEAWGFVAFEFCWEMIQFDQCGNYIR